MKDCVTEEIIEETNEETKLDGLLKKMQRMNLSLLRESKPRKT